MKSRIKTFFGKDRKILYMILSIVLVSIFSLTIVYAALSVTLNITGNAEVVASTWDIHLDNVKVTNGSVSGTDPSITSPTTATFSTTLNMPGDFYEFTIDVVNNGTIDAMIDSVTKTPTLTETQAKYLNYIIEYQNGKSINTKQLVSKNSYVRLKVKVEYRKDINASDLPTTSETLNLSFTVNYVQSDGSGSGVTDNGIEVPLTSVVSGNLDTVGSELCIKKECFYVISSDEDSVTMLAKYNLHVGYSLNSSWQLIELENPTGKQDESAKGLDITADGNIKSFPPIGLTAFSSNEQKGTNYSDYNGSIVEGYVNNYKVILEEFGVTIKQARLITYNELTNTNTFACVVDGACSDKYPWIYSTTYWTGTAVDNSILYTLSNNNYFEDEGTYNLYQYFGVRPVIVISKDYF